MGDCEARLFITGPPRSGKSTIMQRLVDHALGKGVSIGGFFTPEVREGGRRIGFDISVIGGPRVPLARRTPLGNPELRFAGYYLNPEAGSVFREVLPRSPPGGGVLVLDEIGPMELFVPGGRDYFYQVLGTEEKRIVGVVHRKLRSYDPSLANLVRRTSRVLDLSQTSWGQALQEALSWLESCTPS